MVIDVVSTIYLLRRYTAASRGPRTSLRHHLAPVCALSARYASDNLPPDSSAATEIPAPIASSPEQPTSATLDLEAAASDAKVAVRFIRPGPDFARPISKYNLIRKLSSIHGTIASTTTHIINMHNPDPSANFADVLRKVTKELDDVTTQGADLPPKSDLSFHRTLDKEMGKKLDEASSRILEMAQELLALVDPHFTLKQKTFADPAEDLTERYRKNVVPSVDGLLEQTVSPEVMLVSRINDRIRCWTSYRETRRRRRYRSSRR